MPSVLPQYSTQQGLENIRKVFSSPMVFCTPPTKHQLIWKTSVLCVIGDGFKKQSSLLLSFSI